MNIKIRKKVFETNSSSTHALTIGKYYDEEELNKKLIIKPAGFGWENLLIDDLNTKASYIYTALLMFKDKELIEKFKNILIENKINFEIIEKDEYYIDHCDELRTFINMILNNSELLLEFIYSSNSVILTGNDNNDIFEDDLNDIILDKLKNNSIRIYYFKGN